jgi:phage baseplate assembly protein gpV
MPERIYGVVVGLVIDNVDPDDQGRVKLGFPWLPDSMQSGWAPVVRPMAGKDRGFWYAPEVDDEALVAFEHGDINHPMVLGFLHNGVDTPPKQGVDESVRRVKSVAGHVLELDDRPGKESVRLHTDRGHQLELHDASGYTELHTSTGHELRMENTPGSIELRTVSGTSVRLDDTPGVITLQTPTGVSLTISDTGGVSVLSPNDGVDVMAMSATVTTAGTTSIASGGPLTLSAPTVAINAALAQVAGVIQCNALITQSVVSTTYTPGVGNIW